ncbi:MAG: serine acetyltransferase, partial [Desulfobacterales bacterium]
MVDRAIKLDSCKINEHHLSQLRSQLPRIAEEIIETCNDRECYTHVDYEPIPSRECVIEIIDRLREILFPGYFTRGKLDPVNLRYSLGQSAVTVFDMLSEQIGLSIRHDCFRYDQPCSDCEEQGSRLALRLLEEIPSIRKTLATDVAASYDGD